MRPLLLSPALLALVAVGCGGSASVGGPTTVDRSEVEKQTRESLTKSTGLQAPPAKCPEPLKAEVGATTRCAMDFPNSERLGVTVKITKVKDDNDFRIKIKADKAVTDTSAPGATPPRASTGGFPGEWKSNFGRLRLTVSGNRVQGTYEACAGTLSGTVRGQRLEGTWVEDRSKCSGSVSAARKIAEGTFSFTLAADGDAFSGYYEMKGSSQRKEWKGTREGAG